MNTELVERVARAIAAEAVLMFRAYLQGAGAGQQHMTHATTEMEKHLNKSIDAKLATLSPTPVKETGQDKDARRGMMNKWPRCKATTKKGTPCKRTAATDEGLCLQHGGFVPMSQFEPKNQHGQDGYIPEV